MSIMDMLKQLAERTQEPDPMYWVERRPMCATWSCTHEVQMSGDLCEMCTREKTQGYMVLTMTGRCANGAQRDSGILFHAVKSYDAAMCGAKHGKRSRWSEYHGEAVTCPRCLKKITAIDPS
jgi:hypothetical protein